VRTIFAPLQSGVEWLGSVRAVKQLDESIDAACAPNVHTERNSVAREFVCCVVFVNAYVFARSVVVANVTVVRQITARRAWAMCRFCERHCFSTRLV
jgi:hypothetical protein